MDDRVYCSECGQDITDLVINKDRCANCDLLNGYCSGTQDTITEMCPLCCKYDFLQDHHSYVTQSDLPEEIPGPMDDTDLLREW